MSCLSLFAEGSHYQLLFTTSRSGASDSSSEIQQLQQELKTETPACNSAVRSLEAQVAEPPQLKEMIEVERKIDYSTYISSSLWTRKTTDPSKFGTDQKKRLQRILTSS